MPTTIQAVFEDGVFKPRGPVSLEEKTAVRLVVEPEAQEALPAAGSSWGQIDALIGCIPDAPAEAIGRDHDRYLYPK